MGHFAEINSDNKVIRVVVIGNDDIKDSDGNESEAVGIAFCQNLFGGGTWVQTSYNNNFRYNYAGEGYTWDATNNAFIPPKEEFGNTWVLDTTYYRWKPPIAHPSGKNWASNQHDCTGYDWDEENQKWVEAPDSE